jgi:hypothetical protein
MGDPRRRYVVDTIIEFVGSSIESKAVAAQLASETAIDTFLNGSDVQLIAASLIKDEASNTLKLRVSNDVNGKTSGPNSSGSSDVYIVKKTSGPVPGEGFERQLLVTSTVDSPLYSLYMVTLSYSFIPFIEMC